MKPKNKKTLDNVEVGKSIEINGYDYQYVGKKVGKSGEIREVVESLNIDLVVMERPAGLFKSAIITESELIGVVKLYCEEKNINYTEYSATEIKKFFTGKGNAKKADMIEEAKRRFPEINIIDDNHADALALLELAKSDLK